MQAEPCPPGDHGDPSGKAAHDPAQQGTHCRDPGAAAMGERSRLLRSISGPASLVHLAGDRPGVRYRAHW